MSFKMMVICGNVSATAPHLAEKKKLLAPEDLIVAHESAVSQYYVCTTEHSLLRLR